MGNVLHPDLLLARRAAKNDPRAWEEIVQAYGGRIYNLALRFTSQSADAEELTQDVFLRLYRSLDQYRGDVPLVAWALRLSRNLCIDHYRRHRQRLLLETSGDAALEGLASGNDPHRDSQRAEDRRRVHRALAAMSETLSTVLVLCDLQGFSYDEIAEFLEVPLGTVKSRLNRARQELVARLEGAAEALAAGERRSGKESA
jgi:RNA polymerase sigma-70 factor (ECF subfamily)